MLFSTQKAAIVVIAWLLLMHTQASGFDPLAVGSQPQAEIAQSEAEQGAFFASDFEEYSADNAQDLAISPTIEITGDAFISSISKTSWFAGAELVTFRTSYGSVDFDDGGDDKYVASPRFFLGWESKSGFGVRGRVWGNEISGSATSVSLSSTYFPDGFSTLRGFDFRGSTQHFINEPGQNLAIRTGTLDLDFYKRFSTGPTDLVLGAGLRSAGLQFEVAGLMEDTIATGGVSLFSDLRHVLYQTKFGEVAFVANGRVAWLSGEWKHQQYSHTESNDANMTTSEAALGLEWKRDLGWSVMTLRAQYETQLWDSNITSDVAFNGGVIRAGISW